MKHFVLIIIINIIVVVIVTQLLRRIQNLPRGKATMTNMERQPIMGVWVRAPIAIDVGDEGRGTRAAQILGKYFFG